MCRQRELFSALLLLLLCIAFILYIINFCFITPKLDTIFVSRKPGQGKKKIRISTQYLILIILAFEIVRFLKLISLNKIHDISNFIIYFASTWKIKDFPQYPQVLAYSRCKLEGRNLEQPAALPLHNLCEINEDSPTSKHLKGTFFCPVSLNGRSSRNVLLCK